jgi:hypothetical protein
MNYRVEVHAAADGHVCDVYCYQATTGVTACETARQILAARRRDEYGEVSVDDGTGQYLPYATV